MASYLTGRRAGQRSMTVLRNQNGVALITALLISAAVLAMTMGTLFLIQQSTRMSGAGKKYSTAEEVADGAIGVVTNTINMVQRGEKLPLGIFADSCVRDAIAQVGSSCESNITLTPSVEANFATRVRIQRLFTQGLVGSRIEFPPVFGGPPSTGVFYRITAIVQDKRNNNLLTEYSVVYRFTN